MDEKNKIKVGGNGVDSPENASKSVELDAEAQAVAEGAKRMAAAAEEPRVFVAVLFSGPAGDPIQVQPVNCTNSQLLAASVYIDEYVRRQIRADMNQQMSKAAKLRAATINAGKKVFSRKDGKGKRRGKTDD